MYYKFKHFNQAKNFLDKNPKAYFIAWFPTYIVFIPKILKRG